MKKTLIILGFMLLCSIQTSCGANHMEQISVQGTTPPSTVAEISETPPATSNPQYDYQEFFWTYTDTEDGWFFVTDLKLEADSPSSDTGIFTMRGGMSSVVSFNTAVNLYELWRTDSINPVGDESGWDITAFTGTYERHHLDNAPDTVVLIAYIHEAWRDMQYPSQSPKQFPAAELPPKQKQDHKSIDIEQIPSLVIIYDGDYDRVWIAERAETCDFFAKFLSLMPEPHIGMSASDRLRVSDFSRSNLESLEYYHLLNHESDTPSLIFQAD